MKNCLPIFIFLVGMSVFQTVNAADAFNTTCTVTDDRDGDDAIVKQPTFVFDKKNEKTWFHKSFTTKNSENKLNVSLIYNNEDGGLIYLSLVDETNDIVAQTVDVDPAHMYVFLSTKDIGIYVSCGFTAVNSEKQPIKKVH